MGGGLWKTSLVSAQFSSVFQVLQYLIIYRSHHRARLIMYMNSFLAVSIGLVLALLQANTGTAVMYES